MTCLVNLDGKWVPACQTQIPSPTRGGDITSILTKPAIKINEESKVAFFSPKVSMTKYTHNFLNLTKLL